MLPSVCCTHALEAVSLLKLRGRFQASLPKTQEGSSFLQRSHFLLPVSLLFCFISLYATLWLSLFRRALVLNRGSFFSSHSIFRAAVGGFPGGVGCPRAAGARRARDGGGGAERPGAGPEPGRRAAPWRGGTAILKRGGGRCGGEPAGIRPGAAASALPRQRRA